MWKTAHTKTPLHFSTHTIISQNQSYTLQWQKTGSTIIIFDVCIAVFVVLQPTWRWSGGRPVSSYSSTNPHIHWLVLPTTRAPDSILAQSGLRVILCPLAKQVKSDSTSFPSDEVEKWVSQTCVLLVMHAGNLRTGSWRCPGKIIFSWHHNK